MLAQGKTNFVMHWAVSANAKIKTMVFSEWMRAHLLRESNWGFVFIRGKNVKNIERFPLFLSSNLYIFITFYFITIDLLS